jgi:hypothetical protein
MSSLKNNKMDRRSGIKTLLIISAGAVLIPSCLQDDKKSTLTLQNIQVDSKDQELLATLSDTIIPKTDTPGARDVSAHLFALMMVDDCYPPDSREKFVKGMKGFEKLSKKKFDKSFVKASSEEKTQLLNTIANKNGADENVAFFYNNMKWLTIQAFTSSQYYLTKVQVYQLVPGKFYGCVPVNKSS